jgi:UDP-N-acetylglucosamine diphosphorylase / glucose-1-phosphate thymidylyltransferase / UDP-N-acetylgalactosamine diphosphorylase / glucosamine-1-phosphate N-acetyltransferase / galactosamine-1-phosphate N-acetyltransferase
MINIVIPMAGLGSRFVKKGYEKPKPFIDVNGKPMIVRVLENLSYPNAKYILIARKEHLEAEKELVNSISLEYNVKFISIDKLTQGTACTVLFSREDINNSTPLVVANSDQIVDIDFREYVDNCLSRKLDGSILTFKDVTKNPKWSFARINEKGFVVEVKEKEAISDQATVGIYMFSKGEEFVNGAIDMIINNDKVNNEFYTCPVYNYAISQGKKIGLYEIEPEVMHGIGTPEDLDRFLKTF